jgi:hypothetical protein
MGYILCQAQGGINDIACQIWLCTDYAIKHNKQIILTHWSYFGSDLFDVFDFTNYPVKVYPITHIKTITYDALEPAGLEEYVKLLFDKNNNFGPIASLIKDNGNVFDKTRTYPDSTLLLHDSCGGGTDSVKFFKNIGFAEKFKMFFKEKTAGFPLEYNALHIRYTDMKVDADALIKNIHSLGSDPLFIGTDSLALKTKILSEFEHTFSSQSITNRVNHNLHYMTNKEILEVALVDMFIMVFSKNKIEDFYREAQVDNTSGFCQLIDSLKDVKNDIRFKLNALL